MKRPARMRWLTTALGTIVLLGSTALFGLDCPDRSGVWHDGPPKPVFVAATRVFFGSGTVFVTGDPTDSAGPQTMGTIDLGMTINDIVVQGDTAYVAAGDLNGEPGSLFVLDVSDDTEPALIGQLITSLPATAVAADGSRLYLGLADIEDPSSSLMTVVSVADPADPEALANVPIAGWPEAITVDSALVFVVNLGEAVQIFDVAAPSQPTEVLTIPGNIRDLDVDDELLFFAEWDGDPEDHALRIWDLTDPGDPVELGSYNTPYPRGVELWGSSAYILRGGNTIRFTLEKIDVSDPADPVFDDSISMSSARGDLYGHDLSVTGLAAVSHSRGGPWLVRTSLPSGLESSGSFESSAITRALSVDDGMAAAAAGDSGLRLFDLSDPGQPVPLPGGGPALAEYARDVVLSGRIAYVASWTDGIRILDVSNPDNVVELSETRTGFSFFRVVLDGNVLYASHFGTVSAGTTVFDVMDPSEPEVIAEIPGAVLAVSNGFAYADYSDWLGRCALSVWDVSDPSDPGDAPTDIDFWGQCGRCDRPWPDYPRPDDQEPQRAIYGVGIVGGYAMVALGSGGTRVLDLADPSKPVEVSNVEADGCGAFASAADSSAVYLANQAPSGLVAIDLANPANPRRIGFVPAQGFPADLVVSGGYAYTADQTTGISAYNLRGCIGPRRPTGRIAPD